tara:strand:+ start:356 stop:577 length:222 start_codon:yes stop_codon:yes gene_type:complete
MGNQEELNLIIKIITKNGKVNNELLYDNLPEIIEISHALHEEKQSKLKKRLQDALLLVQDERKFKEDIELDFI